MCEYCGCQAVTAINELTREHDLVVNMIGEVRSAYAADDTDRMAALARGIAAVLAPHTEVEKHGLFPLLTDEFPDQVAALEAEHRRNRGGARHRCRRDADRPGVAGTAHRDARPAPRAHPQRAGRGVPGRAGQPQRHRLGHARRGPGQGRNPCPIRLVSQGTLRTH
ncbi:hemerythrin domain-containing protein [Micromonospora sp. KLBMP9576]|uniref:hemerythrin domain-containing protein n=1 Tax=Micromonospora sp. KLBMP9576 TaxID=3424769 RepID=UPI003D8EA11A